MGYQRSLEEKLQEAYEQGRMESFYKQIDETLDNIHYNTMLEIKRRKQVLYENNFTINRKKMQLLK